MICKLFHSDFFGIFLNFFIVNFFVMNKKLTCVSLQAKGSCFRKLFNFENKLSFIIVSKLVLRSLAMYPSSQMAYIIDYSKHFVSCYHYLYLNQSRDHQLLNDVLNATIPMNFKLKENMNHLLILDALMMMIQDWILNQRSCEEHKERSLQDH